MNEIIEKKLQSLPKAPGVYRMLDGKGRIIYIGKSKCLKKRIQSYFVPNPQWEKAEKMVGFIEDVDYTVTDTHLDAMLLECRLIKEIKPYFNVLMKNDQKYLYLKVEKDWKKAPLKLVTEWEDGVFGPFRSRRMAEEWILAMRNLYPLEKVKNSYGFQYHILPEDMSREQFGANREILLELCRKPKAAQGFGKRLEAFMKQASLEERYEAAIRYRDLYQGWCYVSKVIHSYADLLKRDWIYCVPMGQKYKYFYIRHGLVVHTKIEDNHRKEEAVRYGRELKGVLGKNADLPISFADKSSVDFRAIVYGELSEQEEGAELYEI